MVIHHCILLPSLASLPQILHDTKCIVSYTNQAKIKPSTNTRARRWWWQTWLWTTHSFGIHWWLDQCYMQHSQSKFWVEGAYFHCSWGTETNLNRSRYNGIRKLCRDNHWQELQNGTRGFYAVMNIWTNQVNLLIKCSTLKVDNKILANMCSCWSVCVCRN